VQSSTPHISFPDLRCLLSLFFLSAEIKEIIKCHLELSKKIKTFAEDLQDLKNLSLDDGQQFEQHIYNC
jgi:hypothetical protein